MPNYAILSSGIRQVAANTLIGNSTGSTGSAEELSATDAKTLLGLGTTDSPTFAGLDVTNWLTIDGSNFLVETPSGTGSDARIRIDNGENRVELYSYSGSTSPFLRMGGATPGSSVSTSFRHFETGGNHYLNIGDKDGSARWCFSHVGDEFFLSHSAGAIGWSGTYRQAYDSSPDTTLFRDDANILALRNNANAMEFRIYNTDDGSQTNYERLAIKHNGSHYQITSESLGTGGDNLVVLGDISNNGLAVYDYGDNSSMVFYQGGDGVLHLRPNAIRPNNTSIREVDLGTTAARFRTAYLGGNTVTTNTPIFDGTQTWNDAAVTFDAITADITNTASASDSNLLNLKVGGTSKFTVNNAGMVTTAGGNGSGTAGGLMLGNSIGWISRGTGSVELASGSAEYVEIASDGITLRTGNSFGWSANNNPQDATGPRLWENTTDERIELRRGTTALGFAVANTWTDASNFEFGVFDFTTTANTLTIGTEAAGTGTQRSVKVTGGGYTVIQGASGSELHQGGSRVLRCSGAAYFYKSAEPIGTINLGGSSSRWANVYGTNADLSEALTLTSHTPSTTTNKLYNVSGTLYFNGSAAGGNPFDQNLNTTDSPTFGGLEFPASAIINAASGGLFFQSNGSNIFGYTGGQFTAYKSINPADTSRDLGSIAAGKSWRNLIVGRLASITNVIEQSNGTNAQAFNIYNTYTDASNFERACLKWNSNVFEIAAENGGTGTKREISLLPNSFVKIDAGGLNVKHYGNGLTLGSHGLIFKTGSSREIRIHDGETFSTTTPSVTISGFGATFNDSDGDQVVCSIAPTYNQTGTAGGTDILVNRTETAVGSGDQNLMDLQVGGTSKFKVDNAGSAYVGYGTKVASSNSGRIDFSASGVALFGLSNGGATLPTNGYFAFGSNYLNPSRARIYSDADNQIDIRYSTNAQTLNVYNTGSGSDYERGTLGWNSNVFTIGTQAAGTGVLRAVEFVGSAFDFDNKTITAGELQLGNTGQCKLDFAGTSLYATGPEGIIFRFESDTTNASIFRFYGNSGDQLTAASGVQSFFDIDADINQSSTAGYTGIDLDVTETATGSGDKNLIDLKVGGTSKFSVTNAGMITTAGGNGSGTAGGLMLGNSIGWISRGTGSVELASGAAEYVEIASDGITLRTGNSFGWSSNNNPQDSAGPRFWENTSTETIELRRGATSLGFAVANTWTDASNLEFGVFDWTTTSNVLTIGTQAAGTGTVRDLVLATGGTETIKVAGSNQRVTISADRTAIGSGSSHAGVLNLGGDRVLTFHGGNSSIRCPSGQLDFRTATSVFTLVGNAIRFQGYDGGGFLNIRNYSTGGAGTVVIRKLASQTSDLLKVLDDSGNNLFSVQHTGDFVLGLNSTTNPDIYSYGLFTDNSNYERLKIEAGTAYNIRVQAAGTGTGRDLNIHSGASAALRLGVDGTNYIIMTSSGVKPAQDLFPNANNSYKNGTTSNRWSETNTVNLNSTGDINFSGLPTSSSGLSTGDLYLQSSGVPGGDYQIMVKA